MEPLEAIFHERYRLIRKASGHAGISLAAVQHGQYQALFRCAEVIASIKPTPTGVVVSNLGDGLLYNIPMVTVEMSAMPRLLARLETFTSVALVDTSRGQWTCFYTVTCKDDCPV
jgi:hypothetical protein